MIRLLSGAIAAALAAAPVVIMPEPPIAVTALAGLLLATVAITSRWRWPATAAAAVFLVDYTAALWIADARVSIAGAAGFGLGVLYLLESLDLAGRGENRGDGGWHRCRKGAGHGHEQACRPERRRAEAGPAAEM